MPAHIGHKKAGGRKKGSPNKKSLLLMERAEALGVDPFEILLLVCKGDWAALGYDSKSEVRFNKSGECYDVDRITVDHRLKAASEACQYLHPKRKAIVVTSDKDLGKDPLEELSDEEVDAL